MKRQKNVENEGKILKRRKKKKSTKTFLDEE
jgi:hypothetical protein